MPDNLLSPTTIITSHVNADFDAVAAMVAAKKLYPEAVIIAPTLFIRNSDHPFLKEIPSLFSFFHAKQCDLSKVTLLVLVDTRSIKRLEHIKAVLSKPNLRIHIYDHHPARANDLSGEFMIIRQLGSTSTILTEILQEKQISLNQDEATMLGLGIYEDTGLFTHSSTTPNDLAAAIFLMQSGMRLDVIKSLITDITGEQIHLLGALLRNMSTHNIQGTKVAIAEITLDAYMEDFASVVDKLMQIDSNITSIITLAVMHDRVHIIGRSKDPLVDVGKICASFGGGGHSYAASAVVKDQPLAEVKAAVLALLVSTVTPLMTVELYMTSPAKTILSSNSLQEANNVMTRYGLKAVPVLTNASGECVGILEQNISSRSVAHQLGHIPVSEFMQRTFYVLPPEAPLQRAVEIILHERQRLIPIVQNTHVIGVLTRTDIIRLLIDDPAPMSEGIPFGENKQKRYLTRQLKEQVSKEQFLLFQQIGKLADSMALNVFLVGGFIRDLILKQANFDFDLSIEGDALAFAKILNKELNGKIRTHEKFNTAIIFYRNEHNEQCHLDIATARLEYYEKPAALPIVELSSIKMDLYRRDFTINALAIQINERYFGKLIDPFGGQRDIKNKTISVLHSLSLIEDPTRIIRAVRFEQRFSFKINGQTERLIKNALKLGMLDKLSGSRLFNELKHVFDEKKVVSCIERMHELGVLPLISPSLALTPQKNKLLQDIENVITWYRLLQDVSPYQAWYIYLLGFCYNEKYQDLVNLTHRLALPTKEKTDFLRLRESAKDTAQKLSLIKNTTEKASELYSLLYHLPVEGLLYLMARYQDHNRINSKIAYFITQLRQTKLKITGDDLKDLGESPGPLFGETLRFVLMAHLDGKAESRREQLSLANEYMFAKNSKKNALKQVLDGRT